MTPFLSMLFDVSIRISIAACVVGATLLLARVRSSSLRHKAWLGVLCSMLLMPILLQVVPHIEIRIARGISPAPLSPAIPAAAFANIGSPDAPDPAHPSTPNALPSNVQSSPGIQANWPGIILAAYLTGVALFVGRLCAGWLSARNLVKASRRTTVGSTTVYECSHVATPLTIGLRRAQILVPLEWPQWPEQKLTAVLAHESAHVARRDTVTSFLAHLNRCLYWFHPLSWWLQRQLTLAAEEECDAAAVRAIGDSRKYAEVLLDMAEVTRRSGRAFAREGVGVDGAGLLGPRIDRILQGYVLSRASGTQRALIAAACALAVFASAACRENSIYSMPLRPDPENSALLAKMKANREFSQAASSMSAAEAANLEESLRRNPEDMDARKKLMIFYQTGGRQVLGDEMTAAGFRAQRLWCIEHHPENPCASLVEPLSDPAGYQKATKLWLAVARRRDASPEALVAAARFFEKTNPELAEKVVNRENFPDARRTQMLGSIYAFTLASSDSQTPYAQKVRKKLKDSKEAALLAAAGFHLAIWQGPNEAQTRDLGRSDLERALALDPNSTEARDGLMRTSQSEFFSQLYKEMKDAVGREPSEAQYQKAAQLPAAQRLRVLPYLAQQAYITGDSLDYYKHDAAGARNDWELARRYAKDALRLSTDSAGDPNNDARLYMAHMILGMVAMRVDGNTKEARNELLAASTVKTAGNSINPFTIKLPVLLLRYGNAADRKAVIDYLDRYGKLLHRKDLDLLLAARQLRQGIMPVWYQFQSAQLK